MSFLSLKSKISIFFEQRLDSLDSTRQQLDSNCLMTNPTVSRLTEALDRLDSLDSNLEGRGSSQKPCNIGNSVQEISESELIYPQYTNIAANDQEAQEEADWHEFLYGKSTEELLYNHLLTCPLCHVEAAQYCLYGDELGKQYDALLLKQEDAQAKRKALALQVDRACISGRSVLNRVTHANVPPPPNTALNTHKWGNTKEYEAFMNHWTACEVCKPNLGRYCIEGQRLKAITENLGF
ncbi:MAG: hypothetical protein KDI39_16330 [Pseudomonadales bacterium]|nr:hypothetical protein [Pseudomonadales bacterium]